jgi:hypothetical protein
MAIHAIPVFVGLWVAKAGFAGLAYVAWQRGVQASVNTLSKDEALTYLDGLIKDWEGAVGIRRVVRQQMLSFLREECERVKARQE